MAGSIRFFTNAKSANAHRAQLEHRAALRGRPDAGRSDVRAGCGEITRRLTAIIIYLREQIVRSKRKTDSAAARGAVHDLL